MKIVLDQLTKVFPGRGKGAKEVRAVDNFTFEIPDGKLIGLLGPSGCGKSTVLNLLSGLLQPTAGKIYFGEEEVTSVPAENRGVGLVFQNYALYPHLTVLQNITFPLENLKGEAKMTKEERKARAVEVAKLVQIEGLLDRKPGEMSGGQQQRVAIARALVKMPKVLLLDEPLSNLDARLRLQTREEISRIQKETGITTIFVTHDQEEAMSISDLIVVMKDGVVHQIGKPQDVYDDPTNLFVAKFLGTPPINVFKGKLKDGSLYVGEDKLCSVKAAETGAENVGETAAETEQKEEREVYVGIRPEGFVLDENGPLHCRLKAVEVMGRDISVVSTHPALDGTAIRSIISAENMAEVSGTEVRFDVKPAKVFIFDGESEDRVRI